MASANMDLDEFQQDGLDEKSATDKKDSAELLALSPETQENPAVGEGENTPFHKSEDKLDELSLVVGLAKARKNRNRNRRRRNKNKFPLTGENLNKPPCSNSFMEPDSSNGSTEENSFIDYIPTSTFEESAESADSQPNLDNSSQETVASIHTILDRAKDANYLNTESASAEMNAALKIIYRSEDPVLPTYKSNIDIIVTPPEFVEETVPTITDFRNCKVSQETMEYLEVEWNRTADDIMNGNYWPNTAESEDRIHCQGQGGVRMSPNSSLMNLNNSNEDEFLLNTGNSASEMQLKVPNPSREDFDNNNVLINLESEVEITETASCSRLSATQLSAFRRENPDLVSKYTVAVDDILQQTFSRLQLLETRDGKSEVHVANPEYQLKDGNDSMNNLLEVKAGDYSVVYPQAQSSKIASTNVEQAINEPMETDEVSLEEFSVSAISSGDDTDWHSTYSMHIPAELKSTEVSAISEYFDAHNSFQSNSTITDAVEDKTVSSESGISQIEIQMEALHSTSTPIRQPLSQTEGLSLERSSGSGESGPIITVAFGSRDEGSSTTNVPLENSGESATVFASGSQISNEPSTTHISLQSSSGYSNTVVAPGFQAAQEASTTNLQLGTNAESMAFITLHGPENTGSESQLSYCGSGGFAPEQGPADDSTKIQKQSSATTKSFVSKLRNETLSVNTTRPGFLRKAATKPPPSIPLRVDLTKFPQPVDDSGSKNKKEDKWSWKKLFSCAESGKRTRSKPVSKSGAEEPVVRQKRGLSLPRFSKRRTSPQSSEASAEKDAVDTLDLVAANPPFL